MKISFIKNSNSEIQGFTLKKNEDSIEIVLTDTRYKTIPSTIITLLKKKFTNCGFHENFKVLKRIGEGGFCSVIFNIKFEIIYFL